MTESMSYAIISVFGLIIIILAFVIYRQNKSSLEEKYIMQQKIDANQQVLSGKTTQEILRDTEKARLDTANAAIDADQQEGARVQVNNILQRNYWNNLNLKSTTAIKKKAANQKELDAAQLEVARVNMLRGAGINPNPFVLPAWGKKALIGLGILFALLYVAGFLREFKIFFN